MNISSRKAASFETTSYLLSTLQRGNEARHKFERECLTGSTRFKKTLSRIDIKNFAKENIKQKTMESQKPNVAERVRDIFARLFTLAARESRFIDLHHTLCYHWISTISKTTLCQISKKKCSFKEEFSKFVLIEWKKSKYESIIKDNKIYVSHGRKCVLFQLDA